MKKTLKTIISILLILTMSLGLAACSKKEDKSQGVKTDESQTTTESQKTDDKGETKTEPFIKPKNGTKYVLGISQPTLTHPIRKASSVYIEEWLKNHPDVEVIITDGKLDASKQISDIEDLVTQDIDMLLVAAHQSPTLVGVLREVQEADIPILPFDRSLTDTSVQISSILNDDFGAGASAAKLLVEGMGETGKIVILEGPAGNTIVNQRQQGFLSVIKNYPNIEIVDDQVANFQRVQAVDIFENILQAHPDVTGVYAHNDEMALGAVKVLEDAGKIGQVTVVGLDGQKDALESIIDGKLYGTVRKIVEFPLALDMAYKYLTTGEIEDSKFLDPLPITKQNVNDVYDPNAVF